MKQVLIENFTFSPTKSYLAESVVGGSRNPRVQGILATAGVKNGNGRVYKKYLWERENNKYQELIKQRRSFGELDHPDSQIITLKNVSHIITKTWWEGNNLMGEIEILPTPSGDILKALIESNVTIAVSSRGLGSLNQQMGVLEVQDDFELVCWDFVSTPSNPGSFMESIHENQQVNFTDYSELNKVITEILCSNGQCPLDLV